MLTFADEPDALTGNSRAKVHMVPGTEYEKFSKKVGQELIRQRKVGFQ